jgi:hypothetical protein
MVPSAEIAKRLFNIKSWPRPNPKVNARAVSEKFLPAINKVYNLAFPVLKAMLVLITSLLYIVNLR